MDEQPLSPGCCLPFLAWTLTDGPLRLLGQTRYLHLAACLPIPAALRCPVTSPSFV